MSLRIALGTHGLGVGSPSAATAALARDLWLDAGDPGYAYEDGDVFGLWDDISGNEVDFQSHDQPTYREGVNGINNEPCAEYDGAGNLSYNYDAAGDLWDGVTAGTLFLVFETSDSGTLNCIFCYGGASSNTTFFAVFIDNSGQIHIRHDDSGTTYEVESTETGFNDGDTHVLIVESDGSTWTARMDGADLTLSVISGSNDGAWLGDIPGTNMYTTLAAFQAKSELYFLEGKIAEHTLCSPKLDAESRSTEESRLADKYGVTLA